MELIYMIISTVIGALLGSGIVSFYFQKRIENHLNKEFFRFKLIHSSKTDILINLFHLFIKSEKAIQLFLGRREPIDEIEKDEFLKKTYSVLHDFINYVEKNAILIDKDVLNVSASIVSIYQEAITAQCYAALMEDDRPSEGWQNATKVKQELYDRIINEDLPHLKKQLLTELKKRIKE